MGLVSQSEPSSVHDTEAWIHWLATSAGEMGRLIAETDWSESPLGPLDEWPIPLRVSLSATLRSPFPMFLMWGPNFLALYNDAMIPSIDPATHPWGVGHPTAEVWTRTWPSVEKHIRAVFAGERPKMPVEERVLVDRTVPDEERFYSLYYGPMTADTGEVLGVFCVFGDATPRVLADRRLATLLTLSRALGEAGTPEQLAQKGVAAMATNPADHPLTLVFAAQACGGAGRELELLHAEPGVASEVVEVARRAAQQAIAQGARVDVPLGLDDVEDLHAYPIADRRGATPCLVAVIGHCCHRPWDTELATYLDLCVGEFGRALGSLAQLVAERERAETLRELNAAKSQFLANVSHELRTPLTLIAAPLHDVMANPDLPPEVVRPLQLAENSTHRLTRMVDAMLDFTRMEAGRIAPVLTDLDVAPFARALAESFAPVIAQTGLHLVISLPDLPRPAELDADMFERMVLNLLANAVKYTPGGTITVTLADRGDRFALAVTDTGIGIAPEDQQRIFQRFEQLPVPLGSRSPEGAGIGLPMVRSLAQLLGGDVTVESEPGRGSTFTLVLPYSPAPEVERALSPRSVTRRQASSFLREMESWQGIASEPEPAPEASTPSPDRPRLLLVEDSADMRDYLASALSDVYDVTLAVDGQDALERMRARRPHAVLTDVMMPRLDGFALVDAIRADPELAMIPVLMLSARAGHEDASHGMDAGADDYLAKPFSLAELRSRLAANIVRAEARMADAAWRRAIVESLLDPLLLADPAGQILELNEPFTEVFGWSMADGPFTRPYPWWPDAATQPDDHQRMIEAYDRVLAGETVVGEYRMCRRDGTPVWVVWSGALVNQAEGGRTAIMATLRDVTREHASRERRAAAARVAADMASATELEQVLTTAVTGFSVLFDGTPLLRLAGVHPELAFTADGQVPLAKLPERVRTALDGSVPFGVPETLGRPEPTSGILLAGGPEARVGCRTWIQFAAPRTVLTDELIVADLMAEALDLAVDRILAAESFADRQEHLQRAVESHRLVGQAIGILVERHRITPDDGFARLREVSQKRNRKLRDVALSVIETGLDPADL